jgi:hypothetical protein
VHAYLTFSIPVNVEQWQDSPEIPLAAIFPVDYNESTATKVKAYDNQGSIHWLDAKKYPENLVVVVGLNDREELIKANKISFQRLGNRVEPNPLANGRTEGCRVDLKTEYLRGFKYTSIGDYEDWIAGDPETRLVVMGFRSGTAGVVYDATFVEPRRLVTQEFRAVDYYDLFFWRTSDSGMSHTYTWMEIDSGGGSRTVSSSVNYTPPGSSGVSFSTSVSFAATNWDKTIQIRATDFAECLPQFNAPGFEWKTGQL